MENINFQARLQFKTKQNILNFQAINSASTHIDYLNGLCGSGKTYTLIQSIKSKPFSKNLILLPIKILCKEYSELLVKNNIKNFHIIDANHYSGNLEDKFVSVFNANNDLLCCCTIV